VHCTHQGKGDAILFIHGMPTNHKLWDGVIEQLCGRHRCFAVDLPGMGVTPFAPYSPDYLDRMAARIELLRIQHGVEKWHVVGHDAGSAIAVQYAGSFGSNVGCLALLSPALFPDLKPFYLLNPLRQPLLGEVLAPLLHFVFWQIAMRRAFTGKANRLLRRAFYRPFSGWTGAWQFMRLVRWGRPEDMLAEMPATLAQLPMPTLVLQATRDVLPAAFAERAASMIPRSDMVILNAGHFSPFDRPKEVAACLRDFFRENSAKVALPRQDRKVGNRKTRTRRTVIAQPRVTDVRQSVGALS
jgi:pimeloyl-ACP methyl ester carboxylesterase